MSEQILTFTAEEVVRMLKSGELSLLAAPEESPKHRVGLPEEAALVLDLDKEWAKQANKLADLFAEELNQSKDQYIEGLPKFFPQPENYSDRFDIPLIAQTPTSKLTLARMLEITEIDIYLNFIDLKNIKNWEKDPGKFKTPKTPYVTWLDDGVRNLKRSVADVRTGLALDERGGTLLDGLALLIQNPDILRQHYLDLPGSQYGSDCAPFLSLYEGRLVLGYDFVEIFNFRWGSVVAGRNIRI